MSQRQVRLIGTLPHVVQAASMEDSLENSAVTISALAAHRHNCAASIRIRPTSTMVTVYAVSNISPTLFLNQAVIALIKPSDGSVVDSFTVATPQNTINAFKIGFFTVPSLLVGTVLEIREGTQNLVSSVVQGSFVYAVNGAVLLGAATVARRAVCYGDSITCGYLATTPIVDGWSMLTRKGYPGRVALEAWGSRTLSVDQTAGLGTLASRLVGLLFAAATRDLLLFIGTNDYGFATISAATFQTHYATLLDDIHGLDATLNLYAITPLLRTGENTNNGLGSNLPAYRTAISNACSGRVWATFVDAAAWISGGQLDADGVHPTSAGHIAIAAQVKTLLGF